MKAKTIFTCWATLPDGRVKRLTVNAHSQDGALATAFALAPTSTAMSCRLECDQPPRDALALLDRRATPRARA